jgi:acyl-homoserine-lactone acylase
MNRLLRGAAAAAVVLQTAGCAALRPAPFGELSPLAQRVEIRRTVHGVPHILATDLRAAAYALAWVQLEDHGESIIRGMHAARGRLAEVEGAARIDADARARQRHRRAVETFGLLHRDTRDIYIGFAAGLNRFIRVHRAELPAWVRPDFTPEDVLARDIVSPADGAIDSFRRLLLADTTDARVTAPVPGARGLDSLSRARPGADARVTVPPPGVPGLDDASGVAAQEPDNVGSNAWALAPERTVSGHAILLRNPHLPWTAGYYEAHLRVPGVLDFYGDFRIGGPFTVIGGFNPYLGFATTNNASRSHEYYALRMHPTQRDHYLLDGRPHPLLREEFTVRYRTDAGTMASAARALWSTAYGPVVHRNDSLVYVYRPAAMGHFRAGEQWLEMMTARSLAEWQEAMRIGARTTSNFTYADRDGNIFYVWVSAAPRLPHAPGGDTVAILATASSDIWREVVRFDELPQLHNPPGGYVRNENDSPHFTNLYRIMPDTFSFEVEPPSLRLRSQHGLLLLHNDRRFTLEDVVEAKHSMRMLLADRVKADLLAAVASARPDEETARAAAFLARWDNTVAADSRGGVLFEAWWTRYRALLDGAEPHAVPWRADEPTTTPRGLAAPSLAVDAFREAVQETARRYGSWAVAWGEVHRVRRGNVDVPVGGCSGALGCFRVLNFATAEDGRRYVTGGDGWVIAVEFGPVPRAYSVLASGQSPDPDSPHHADQAAMFAANRMKRVHWTEGDIEAATVLRYRPGARRDTAAEGVAGAAADRAAGTGANRTTGGW